MAISGILAALAGIGSAVGSAAGAVGGAAAGAAGAAGSALGAAGSAIGSAAGSVGSALGSAGSSIASGLGQAGSAIGNVAQGAVQGIGQAGQSLGNGLQGILGGGGQGGGGGFNPMSLVGQLGNMGGGGQRGGGGIMGFTGRPVQGGGGGFRYNTPGINPNAPSPGSGGANPLSTLDRILGSGTPIMTDANQFPNADHMFPIPSVSGAAQRVSAPAPSQAAVPIGGRFGGYGQIANREAAARPESPVQAQPSFLDRMGQWRDQAQGTLDKIIPPEAQQALVNSWESERAADREAERRGRVYGPTPRGYGPVSGGIMELFPYMMQRARAPQYAPFGR